LKTLKELVDDAFETVESGYYNIETTSRPSGINGHLSLVRSIESKAGKAIICEIKFASPSAGKIDERYNLVSQIAKDMEAGGAAGLSVLTEPKNFSGSIENLKTVRASTNLPVIMKDIVVSEEQIKAARRLGASAVLFIREIFSDGYSKEGLTLPDAIGLAKNEQLEVIVETHSTEGLAEVAKSDCDIIGINNRDLKTFKTTITTTVDLLVRTSSSNGALRNHLLMSESGFESPADITGLIRKLKESGAPLPKAFLIGTSIMKSPDIRTKVREFTAGVA